MLLKIFLLLNVLLALPLSAEPLTIYTGRHYDADRQLYKEFTQQTGIDVVVIEGKDDALLQRLDVEGEKTKADVLVTVDAGRLYRAKEQNLFKCALSKKLTEALPARSYDNDGCWYGFAQRARVIIYNKTKGYPEGLEGYESLALPLFKDSICVRSSNNIYNQSLVASLIATHGAMQTKNILSGWVENFARKPRGNDRDQIRSVLEGSCRLGVVNSYYIPRFTPEQLKDLGVIFPNQLGRGAHVNISGAGVVQHSDQPAEAQKFLEFLATPKAQRLFAHSNNEYPVLKSVEMPKTLQTYGEFKADPLPASKLGELNRDAVKLMDIVGWR